MHPVSAPPVFDEPAALARVDGHVDLQRELAAILLEDAPQSLAQFAETIAPRTLIWNDT